MNDLVERLRNRSGDILNDCRVIDSAFLETAADEITRLTARVAELEEHCDILRDKVSDEDCACGYDKPGDVCLVHRKIFERAKSEARAKALRAARVAIYQKVKAEDSAGRAAEHPDRARRHDHRAGAFEDAMRVIDDLSNSGDA